MSLLQETSTIYETTTTKNKKLLIKKRRSSPQRLSIEIEQGYIEDDSSIISSESESSWDKEQEFASFKRSVTSNVLFLLGSTWSTILSILELKKHYYKEQLQALEISDGNDDYYGTSIYYENVSLAVSILYCLNAFMDYKVARGKINTADVETSEYAFIRRLQSINSESASAICFGAGAFIDLLISTMTENYKLIIMSLCGIGSIGDFDKNMGKTSVHLYFLSAVFCLLRSDFTTEDVSSRVYLLGDLLFMAGSVIDLVTNYLADPFYAETKQVTLLWLYLLSCELWLIDACLYLLGDFFWFNTDFSNQLSLLSWRTWFSKGSTSIQKTTKEV